MLNSVASVIASKLSCTLRIVKVPDFGPRLNKIELFQKKKEGFFADLIGHRAFCNISKNAGLTTKLGKIVLCEKGGHKTALNTCV